MWEKEDNKWSNKCNNCCATCIVERTKTKSGKSCNKSCMDFSEIKYSIDCDICSMDKYYNKEDFNIKRS